MKPARVRRTGPLLVALALAALAPAAGAATLLGLIDTGELFRSTDGGVTWTGHAALPVRDAVALGARLSANDLFLLSRTGSVYHSVDGGAAWNVVGVITAPDLVDLAIRPDGALLALAASGSVYLSTDQGTTFSGLAALTGSNFVSLASTAPAVRHYAMTRTGEVYESEDGGTAWSPKGVFTAPDALQLRGVGNSLFAMTGTGSVYRSDDRGTSWTVVGTLSQVGMGGLVANGATLVAATREGHVATSSGGANWTWVGSMNQLALTALATDALATTGVGGPAPVGLALGPPYPSPSTAGLSFAVRLDQEAGVEAALFDLAGRRVATRPTRRLPAGAAIEAWDPGPLPAGLYLLRVAAGGHTAFRRWVRIGG